MSQRPGRPARVAGFIVAAGLAVSCATNPATGKKEFNLMSEAQEVALGKESDAQVRKEMGVVNDPALQRYVDGVARRLASGTERPSLPWTFAVVDSPAVNAFALARRVRLPHPRHPRPPQQRGGIGGRPGS